ncbi:hypothetical protein AAC387_Pa03g0357 [Persea americana]|eukprot:TRINITY_DN17125_c0_g1_i1.p1 TRINITY_DN17125_c0_g1~~TRINITY_DN17125_c0_g1_i1.p1  ORF type:complete len:652 (-),score=142.73 TRINITY_DN17125_c0_g1_i1:256-2211(-)
MMMAVSLLAAGVTDFSNSMKMVGDTMSIFSREDQLLSLSRENKDQIRKTMMQHEELFKEQVQALHKLYIVQKSAMQEVRKIIGGSAQPLAFSSNNKDACCDRPNDSIVEGKHSNEAYASAKDHTDESCVLPINLLSAVKEFTGSSSERSFCSDIKEVKVSPNACNEQKKIFDLERPPEEYMDESDYQIESNNFDILLSNTHLLGGSHNIVEESSMRCNQADFQMGYPSSKQKDKRPDFGAPSEPSQESRWDCSPVSESKTHNAYMKCTSVTERPQETANHNIQNFSWGHLPAIGLSPSNPSVDSQVEKPLWLFQKAVPSTMGNSNCAHRQGIFESEELDLEKSDPRQLKGKLPRNADHMDSTQLYPTLEINSKTVLPCLEVEKQLQQEPGERFPAYGGLLPVNPTNCPQSSSDHCIQEVSCSLDMKPPARDLNSCSCVLTIQTGDSNENPNRSGHGSNSSYECEVKFRDKDFSTVTSNKEKCSSDCEPVEIGSDKAEAMKSGLKEASQLGNNDDSSSATDSNNKQRDAAELKCALNYSETEKVQEETKVAKESKEEVESDSTLEEACESIAAKILLSFAPSKSHSDSKLQFCETQIEVETSQSGRESVGDIQKQQRRTRRTVNYRNGVCMDEAVKWTESVCGRRRRSSRRQ